jgi:hypothetical protein
MSWLNAVAALLGALGTLWGAVNGHRTRGHRQRLEALEGQHRAAQRPRFLEPPDGR